MSYNQRSILWWYDGVIWGDRVSSSLKMRKIFFGVEQPKRDILVYIIVQRYKSLNKKKKMNRKLYFTVDSNTEIHVYEIKNDVPKKILELFPMPMGDKREEIRFALVEELGWSEQMANEFNLILL